MFKPLRALTLSLIALASSCAAAPPPDAAEPGTAPGNPSGEQACTMIGCVNGFVLTTKAEAWPAGSYRFVVKMDEKTVTCEGSLPLPACDKGLSLKCDGEGVMIGESGCALPAEQHGYSDMHLDGQPATVNIRVERDGEVKASQDFTPEYKTLYPNGESCGPVCKQASGTLSIGPAT